MGSRGTAARALRAAIALLFLAANAAAADPVRCAPDQALLSSPDGKPIATFSIEIADDPQERALGLMNRETMPRGAGMLFVYPDAREVSFWMHDTLIPLDMIFIDESGRVVRVAAQARPLDETPVPSGAPVRFVLEINGGLAARLGIVPGAVLSHPSIEPANAALPCQ